MDGNPLADSLHFLFGTVFLVLGSVMLTSQLGSSQYPFALVPGGFLLCVGFTQASYFCYRYLRRTVDEKTEGGYVCPRCQSLCHPDATRCWNCDHQLDAPIEWIISPQYHLFSKETRVGTCCVCGEAGYYYRNGRWFCFDHRIMGR